MKNYLTKQEQMKRDNAIVQILKTHRGVSNSIKATEIAKQLNEQGFKAIKRARF